GLIFQSEVKEHLNGVIDFIEKSDNKQIYAYYSHMRNICDKSQTKIEHFFKANK
ncbi:hypothetical protein C0J52_26554, partial [Blattella germanica]